MPPLFNIFTVVVQAYADGEHCVFSIFQLFAEVLWLSIVLLNLILSIDSKPHHLCIYISLHVTESLGLALAFHTLERHRLIGLNLAA